MKLVILIPSLHERKEQRKALFEELSNQIVGCGLQNKATILSDVDDGSISVGTKRNDLIALAVLHNAEYIAFFDDDDWPGEKYIEVLWEGIKRGADCCSLRGHITVDGGEPEIFEHSLKYDAWKTTSNEIKYERYPNHLNCIKTELAKQIKFPEKDFGEDHDWSKALHEAGLLKKEHYSDEVIYHYRYKSEK